MTPTCVLTAAHCVVDYQPPRLSILAGTSKLRGGGGKRYLVQSIKVHPNYKELVTSDIAVMKINGTFDFDDPKIAPIKYSSQAVGGGVNLTLTGWGYTTPIRIGAPPNDLQVAVLPSITNDECQKEGMNVTETEMCTYSRLFQGACGVSGSEFSAVRVLSERSRRAGRLRRPAGPQRRRGGGRRRLLRNRDLQHRPARRLHARLPVHRLDRRELRRLATVDGQISITLCFHVHHVPFDTKIRSTKPQPERRGDLRCRGSWKRDHKLGTKNTKVIRSSFSGSNSAGSCFPVVNFFGEKYHFLKQKVCLFTSLSFSPLPASRPNPKLSLFHCNVFPTQNDVRSSHMGCDVFDVYREKNR